MSPLAFTLLAFGISVAAGFVGALLGLGGGIIVVPALTLLLHVDIRLAIGASIVSVIATSSGAAAAYVRDHLTNLRIAMFLEVATTAGALTGALAAGLVDTRWLEIVFGVALALSALAMLRKRSLASPSPSARSGSLADRLRLSGAYDDAALRERIEYRARRAGTGFGLMYIAGVISGLLGIGSGALKVLAMDLAMGLPMKVSTATSNFMIGVTAAASAGVYFARGDIHPLIAAPVASGVLAGAFIGSRLMGRLQSRVLRIGFVGVALWIAVEMLVRGVKG